MKDANEAQNLGEQLKVRREKLKILQEMVYPLVGKSTAPSGGASIGQQVDYGKKGFSSSMNNTLNQMKKKNF